MRRLPFKYTVLPDGRARAKMDDVWEAAKKYGKKNGLKTTCHGVETIAPL